MGLNRSRWALPPEVAAREEVVEEAEKAAVHRELLAFFEKLRNTLWLQHCQLCLVTDPLQCGKLKLF